jgi:DNA-binding transcriptional LysR family regulator
MPKKFSQRSERSVRKVDDRAMFVAVADSGSFTDAPSRLGVPVSTISRRISGLEVALEVSLLERTTRHVRLTELGREYADHLRPLLSALDDLEATLSTQDSLATGILRIASPPGLDRPFFGPAMVALYAAHPGVEIVWSAASDVHPIRDGFDIVITEQRIVDTELVARKVLSTREVCVASPNYLARRGRPSSARELGDHDVLALGVARGPMQWPLFRGGTLTVTPVLRCNDYGLLIEAAVHGLGIALVPLIMVRAHPREGELELVLDGIVGARRDVHLSYARSARKRGVVRAFVEFVLDYVQSVPILIEG